MRLADLPYDVTCTIAWLEQAVKGTAYQIVAGLTEGSIVRLVARLPAAEPRYLEIEVNDSHTVTVPASVARHVVLACEC